MPIGLSKKTGQYNFTKGHKLSPKKKGRAIVERKKELALIPKPTVATVAEILMEATNKVIDVYNKVAYSIKDEDIAQMTIIEKVNTLQKLSYLHTATKTKSGNIKSNLNFIKINTDKKSAEQLEDSLLKFDEEQQDDT